MLSRALFVLLLVIAFRCTHAADACTSSADCLSAVAEVQRRVRSLSARFVQTKHVSLLTEPIETNGRFTFTHPDTISWQVEDPPFEIRVDAGKVQLPPGEELSLAATWPALSGLFSSMSAMFTGDTEKALRAFDVKAHGSGDAIVVLMTPKDSKAHRMAESIRLTFAQPDLLLRDIHIEEAVGDKLDIVFQDTKRTLAEP
jgi:outer membrane lipoprotein-sorting protein